MGVKTFRIKRNMNVCHGLRSCSKCVEVIPALEYDGLLISAPNLVQHEKEIEQIILDCPSGAIEVVQI